MKQLFLILFCLVNTTLFSQSFDQKLASQIYRRIDSTGKLKCCDLDENRNVFTLTYQYKTEFEVESIQSISVPMIYDDVFFQIESTELADDILESWKNKIKNKKFNYSCYKIDKKIIIQDKNDFEDKNVSITLNFFFYFY